MKRPFIPFAAIPLLAVITALAVAPAAAQPPAPQAPTDRPLGFGPFIARYLELTEEQIADAAALGDGTRAAAQPVAEELRATRRALRDLLAGEEPDPTAVGELVLASRDLGAELRAIKQGFEEGFEALLTPEQLVRWDALQAALRLVRHGAGGGGGPGGDGLGDHGPGDPGPPGDGLGDGLGAFGGPPLF